MGELLKKKALTDKEPVFDHSHKGVEEAIGCIGIVESLGEKINKMQSEVTITSPSKAIDYLYTHFSKLELAFFLSHLMSKEVVTDLEDKTIDEEI